MRVYPVPGAFLMDVPAVAHECTDKRCVDSGAFTTKKPPGAAEPANPEDPPSGGSPDSEET